MVPILLFLLVAIILLGGPVAVGALSRGRFKLGLSLAACVTIATMFIAPPTWFEPAVRSVGAFLK